MMEEEINGENKPTQARTGDTTQKQNDLLQLSGDLLHPSELGIHEKLHIFSHYMRNYYQSLGK